MRLSLPVVVALAVLLFAPLAYSERSVASLAKAINTWRGDLLWFECGRSMDAVTGSERAHEYASEIFRVAEAYSHNPVILAAMIEQESGYDECGIGRPARVAIGLPAHPSRDQVIRSVGRMRAKGVSRLDAGAAQFRWPRGSPYGVTDGVPIQNVLSMPWSVEALGVTLARHRESCRPSLPVPLGGGLRTHSQVYWVLHNSPARYNPTYFARVRAKAARLWAVMEG